MYNHGWYKVAYESELSGDLTPVALGPRRFALARTETGIRAFDADCPHKGAHLAYGGKLERNSVICPFHRYRIGIGWEAAGDFQVREYETLAIDGIIFMRLSESHDNGFAAFITRLAEEHTLNPGFTMEIKCPAELIIENGFDYTHFRPVHGVDAERFFPKIDEQGALVVDSTFHVQVKDEQRAATVRLTAFSPYLSVAQVGGSLPQAFMTSVTPLSESSTLLRFSLALSKKKYGNPPSEVMVKRMLEGNKYGIHSDVVIWEHVSLTAPHNYTSQDASVLEYQKYCQTFR